MVPLGSTNFMSSPNAGRSDARAAVRMVANCKVPRSLVSTLTQSMLFQSTIAVISVGDPAPTAVHCMFTAAVMLVASQLYLTVNADREHVAYLPGSILREEGACDVHDNIAT